MSRFKFILCLWLLPLLAFAQNAAHINGLLLEPGANQSIFNFILSKKTSGHVKYRPIEQKLYIKFNHADPHLTIKDMTLDNANVRRVVATETKDGKVEFVFYLTKRVKWAVRFLPNKGANAKALQLTLTTTGKVFPEKLAPVVAAKPVVEKIKLTKEQKKEKLHITKPAKAIAAVSVKPRHETEIKKDMMIVAIDPGHGGKDPGTIGVKGAKEKDVVLKIAQKFANKINSSKGMRAVLTRTGDYFITLRDRLQLARKNDADLFISIHADGFYDKRARGVSVYALSQRGATSEAGRWLAKRERYSELGDVDFDKLAVDSKDVRSVLIDMAQTATIQTSMRLGDRVLKSLDSVSHLHSKKVSQAPFVVLKSPDIPSILVETGFLTNPSEERRLKGWRYQNKIASALHKAVKNYKKATVV